MYIEIKFPPIIREKKHIPIISDANHKHDLLSTVVRVTSGWGMSKMCQALRIPNELATMLIPNQN